MQELSDRHPATQHMLAQFAPTHLPEGLPRETGARCSRLAYELAQLLPDGPELSFGLRQLLIGTDAFVRAAVEAQQAPAPSN